jgi:hypothetical protein
MEWKFFTDHLAPGERLGETLFGLIMTLTFTIGAGFVVGTAEGASTALLYATIGCNVAWGLIDGVLLVLGRMFDRGRLVRLVMRLPAPTRNVRWKSWQVNSTTHWCRSRRTINVRPCTATWWVTYAGRHGGNRA